MVQSAWFSPESSSQTWDWKFDTSDIFGNPELDAEKCIQKWKAPTYDYMKY